MSSVNPMIRLEKADGFSYTELKKSQLVFAYANRVFLDDQFKEEVLKISSFSNTDLNGPQVWQKLCDSDLSISVYLFNHPWYRRWSSEVAREGDGAVGILQSYFNSAKIETVVNTIIHESTHKAGFEHDFLPTARRPNSVPYRLGDLAETVCARIILTDQARGEQKTLEAKELG